MAARSAEKAAVNEVRRVERAVRGAQESVSRLKNQLGQVRAQCANDVRKRDAELARLRAHLQGGQRGTRGAGAAPGLTVIGGGNGRAGGGGGVGARGNAFAASVRAVGDPAYSLKQETTEFLTQLSQSLSDENDGLIGLIRDALGTMKELLGQPAIPDSAIGSRGSEDYNGQNIDTNDTKMLHALPASYVTLSADLSATLNQLKTILTNPNFVPISEVEAREDEIAHLREGWERMEQRWRDVLMMMEGWRRKMDGGATIDLDDLTKGMGLASPQRDEHYENFRASKRQSLDESTLEDSINDGIDEASEIMPPPSLDADEQESLQQPAAHADLFSPVARKRKSSTPTKRKRDALEPPEYFDVRPSTAPASSPKHRSTYQLSSLQRSVPSAGPRSNASRSTKPSPRHHAEDFSKPASTQAGAEEGGEEEDFNVTLVEADATNATVAAAVEGEYEEQHHPFQNVDPDPDGDHDSDSAEEPQTVAQKLAAAQAEAEAATAARTSPTSECKPPNSSRKPPSASPSSGAKRANKAQPNNHDDSGIYAAESIRQEDSSEDGRDDTLGHLLPPPPSVGKSKGKILGLGVKGRAKRRSRKSTLSPEELGELLGME